MIVLQKKMGRVYNVLVSTSKQFTISLCSLFDIYFATDASENFKDKPNLMKRSPERKIFSK